MSWWTQHYGKTYDEWVNQKADRILKYLIHVYKDRKIDPQALLEYVYIERLLGISSPDYSPRKHSWKPIDERLTDFKPSPFMKSFIDHVISELKLRGHLLSRYVVEIAESARITDRPITTETEKMPYIRIYKTDTLISLPTKEELIEICRWQP